MRIYRYARPEWRRARICSRRASKFWSPFQITATTFRSGSSIAAAHVSGVVALLLSDDPDLSSKDIEGLLKKSQTTAASGLISVNACAALKIIDAIRDCS